MSEVDTPATYTVGGCRTIQFDDLVLVIGKTREDCEAVVVELRALQVTGLSSVEPYGREWAFTLPDPDGDACDQVQVTQVGLRTVIRGPTERCVTRKLTELVRNGAKLITSPQESTGGAWLAVCDNIEQVRKW